MHPNYICGVCLSFSDECRCGDEATSLIAELRRNVSGLLGERNDLALRLEAVRAYINQDYSLRVFDFSELEQLLDVTREALEEKP